MRMYRPVDCIGGNKVINSFPLAINFCKKKRVASFSFRIVYTNKAVEWINRNN